MNPGKPLTRQRSYWTWDSCSNMSLANMMWEICTWKLLNLAEKKGLCRSQVDNQRRDSI